MAEPMEIAALAQAQAAEAAGGALSGTAGVIQTSADIALLESALNRAKAPSMNFQRVGGRGGVCLALDGPFVFPSFPPVHSPENVVPPVKVAQAWPRPSQCLRQIKKSGSAGPLQGEGAAGGA